MNKDQTCNHIYAMQRFVSHVLLYSCNISLDEQFSNKKANILLSGYDYDTNMRKKKNLSLENNSFILVC